MMGVLRFFHGSRVEAAGGGNPRNDLRGWDFSGQNLINASLRFVKLAGADLTGALVNRTDFYATTSHGFSKEQLYSTVSYQAKDLKGIKLDGNNLTGWDLSEQNLANAYLGDLNLTNTSMTGADLAGAYLVRAKLTDVNLTGVNLSNADLWDADLSGAVFADSTVYNQWTRFPGSFRPETSELTFVRSALGDLDGIAGLSETDVDLLTKRMRGQGVRGAGEFSRFVSSWGFGPSEMFDLNSDTTIDTEDVRVWVEDLKGTHFGDANLDGSVSFPDFLALVDHFGGPGGWGQGDFDADGAVRFPDFLILAGNYGTTSTTVTTAVPEPCSAVILAIGGLLIGAHIYRRT